MSSIFIIGATGFIGLPVATALRRAGYLVYGHARSAEKAKILAQNEIIPIQGDVKKLADILPPTVEIVIDTAGLFTEAVELLQQLKKIGGGRKPTDPKLGFIYTSGVWVHGSGSELYSEARPLGLHTKPADIVAWRPDLESQILASRDILDVTIVRPALLYGGDGSIWKMWLEPIRQAAIGNGGEAAIFGDPASAVLLVHKDDLADLYVKVVEQFTVIAASTYPVLDAASHQEQLGEVITAFAKTVDFKGQITYKAPSNPFEEAMLTQLNFRANKARGLLGWVPKQIPFAQGIKIYAEAYKAWN